MPESVVIKGTAATLRWGTGGILQTPLNAAIVKSVRCSRLNGGGPIKIEDNDGFTAMIALLNDGDALDITVVDDSTLTWPEFGDVVSFKKPGDSAAKEFLIVDDGSAQNRKQEGERTFKAEFYSNIDLSPA